MQYYVVNGYKELSIEALPKLLSIHFGTLPDATRKLNMGVEQIRDKYLDFQRQLYHPLGLKQAAGLTVNIIANDATINDYSTHFNEEK